jgi:hypothetical protein
MNRFVAGPSIHRREGASPCFAIGDGAVILLYSFALFIVAGVHRALQAGAPDSVSAVVEFSAAQILALGAIYRLVRSAPGAVALSGADLAVISCAALLLASPFSVHPAFAGAGLAGLWLMLRRRGDARLVAIGQLWLALGAYVSFGRLLFPLISEAIVRFELEFMTGYGRIAGFRLPDGIPLVASDGWFITLIERSWSFHNLSLAVLLWLSLTRLAGVGIRRRQLTALGVAVVLVLLLNATRLMLMTGSRESYPFWHDGTGAVLISSATLLAVLLPTAISLRRAL